MSQSSLFQAAAAALAADDPAQKITLTRQCWADWQAGLLKLEQQQQTTDRLHAGRPARPELVPPQQVERRRLGSITGRAALIHAICHIEFNAINLALDALCRFPEMPRDYHHDWLRVAAEEAYHFQLLSEHLQRLGFTYGDFSAHNGLWDMAEKTAYDALARMAMVPRLLEARGLDVTPGMQARLLAAGDSDAAAILDIIFRDEVGHVAIGNRWFRWLCQQRGLEPIETFRQMLPMHDAPRSSGPLNREARLRAGFTEEELCVLEAATIQHADSKTPSAKQHFE